MTTSSVVFLFACPLLISPLVEHKPSLCSDCVHTALSTSSPTSNFVRCPPTVLDWGHRSEVLLTEIKEADADIICLEEVDHFHDFFKPQMEKLGYASAFLPKTSSPCLEMPENNGPDGCALFVRKTMFQVTLEHQVKLLDAEGKTTSQVALVQLLKFTKSRKAGGSAGTRPDGLCVAVTHLKSKPQHAALRVAQGKCLLSEISALSSQYPLVLCGDFNAEPQEDVCKAMEQSKFKLQSAYPNQPRDFTTWKFRPNLEVCHLIDYIWFETSELLLQSRLELPSKPEIGEDGLPCAVYPSDHIALGCEFLLP